MIVLNKVSKSYSIGSIEVPAIQGIDLSINERDFLAIIGASGSGKTTLLKILGLLDNDFKGDYLLDGINVKNFSDTQISKIRNKKIGFVFQEFNLINRLTVFENVQLPSLYNNSLKINKVRELLEKMGLEDKKDMFPNLLSGGQQQRVSIARALINDPQIIIADEPTGALDSKTSSVIMEIFKHLNKIGKTIILITHDKDVASEAKKIVEIRDGVLV